MDRIETFHDLMELTKGGLSEADIEKLRDVLGSLRTTSREIEREINRREYDKFSEHALSS